MEIKYQKYPEFAEDELSRYKQYSTTIIKQYVQSLKYLTVLNDSYLLSRIKQVEVSKLQTILFLKNLIKIEKSFWAGSNFEKKK